MHPARPRRNGEIEAMHCAHAIGSNVSGPDRDDAWQDNNSGDRRNIITQGSARVYSVDGERNFLHVQLMDLFNAEIRTGSSY